MTFERILFQLYIIITLFSECLILLNVPIYFKEIDTVLFVIIMIYALLSGQFFKALTKIRFIFLPLFFIFFVFWGIANGNKLEAVIMPLRLIKNVFLIFAVLSLQNNYAFLRKAVFLFLLFSVPVSVYQFITYSHPDYVTGLVGYGGSGTLSLLILTYACSEFFIRLKNKTKLIGFYILVIIPVFINETKITFILLPIISVVILFVIKKINFKSLIVLGIAGSILFIFVNYVYQKIYHHNWSDILVMENMEGYMKGREGNEDVGRLTRVLFAYDYISKKGPLSMLFGHGMGSTFVGSSTNIYGIDSQNFIRLGINKGSKIQLFVFIIEYGILGTLLFVVFIIFSFLSIYRQEEYSDYDIYSMVMIMIVIVGLIYQPILYQKSLTLVFYSNLYLSFLKKT